MGSGAFETKHVTPPKKSSNEISIGDLQAGNLRTSVKSEIKYFSKKEHSYLYTYKKAGARVKNLSICSTRDQRTDRKKESPLFCHARGT
jgi:hypothetical protein